MTYEAQGPNSYRALLAENDLIHFEAAHELFHSTFGNELKEIGEWIEAAPASVDIEAALESGIDSLDFDASDDGDGTNWQWVQDAIESYSPRLKAARLARQKKWGA